MQHVTHNLTLGVCSAKHLFTSFTTRHFRHSRLSYHAQTTQHLLVQRYLSPRSPIKTWAHNRVDCSCGQYASQLALQPRHNRDSSWFRSHSFILSSPWSALTLPIRSRPSRNSRFQIRPVSVRLLVDSPTRLPLRAPENGESRGFITPLAMHLMRMPTDTVQPTLMAHISTPTLPRMPKLAHLHDD